METKNFKNISLKILKGFRFLLVGLFKAPWLIIKALADVFSLPFRIIFLFDEVVLGGWMTIKREKVNLIVDRSSDNVYIEYKIRHSIKLKDLWPLIFFENQNDVYYIIRKYLGLLTGTFLWGYIICKMGVSIRSLFF